MSEEERARKFVERHFPVTAAFLAADGGGGPAPVYGPSSVQNAHDDQPEPFVRVRVDYQMSRVELFAVLAAGYATTNTGQDPDAMTVDQIRYDVEAQLSLMSWREMEDLVETSAGQIERGEHPEQMAALKRAVDRAYPPRREPSVTNVPVAVQAPRYGDGTVTLQTLDHGEITIPEPRWCTGHDGEQIVQRVDVTHVGRTVAAELETDGGTVEFLPARISWGPFAELRPEPYPLADVDGFPGLDASQLRELAAEVGLHAGRLYRLSNELDRLRRAES